MMAISQEDYLKGKKGLMDVLRYWETIHLNPKSPDDKTTAQRFEAWLQDVQSRGWQRKDVHDLILDIWNNHYKEFHEDAFIELREIEDAITGYCHPSAFIRFPGDPTEETDFVDHVRGEKWR